MRVLSDSSALYMVHMNEVAMMIMIMMARATKQKIVVVEIVVVAVGPRTA